MISGPPLTPEALADAAALLAHRDPDLARVLDRLGPPPLWGREPGFPTLVHIILEQQVSLASARSAFDRLNTALPSLEPAAFLKLDDVSLRMIGFSSQKARYCRNLADAVLVGTLDLSALPALSDDAALRELTQIIGIGPWTAEIYLLMVLGRPDVWPAGDLALAVSIQGLRHLPERPTPKQLRSIAELWRPFRAVAARLLWNHYLHPPQPSLLE